MPFANKCRQLVGSSEATFHKQIQQYVESLDVDGIAEQGVHLILLKSVACAVEEFSSTKVQNQSLDQKQVTKKLCELLVSSISRFTSKLKKPEKLVKDEGELLLLDLTLRAAESIKGELSAHPLKISSKTLDRLASAGEALASQGVSTGWRLQTVMVYNQKQVDTAAFLKLVGQEYSASPDSQLVFEHVDAVTRQLDSTARLELAHQLLSSSTTWKSPDVPYLALERVVDTIQGICPVLHLGRCKLI